MLNCAVQVGDVILVRWHTPLGWVIVTFTGGVMCHAEIVAYHEGGQLPYSDDGPEYDRGFYSVGAQPYGIDLRPVEAWAGRGVKVRRIHPLLGGLPRYRPPDAEQSARRLVAYLNAIGCHLHTLEPFVLGWAEPWQQALSIAALASVGRVKYNYRAFFSCAMWTTFIAPPLGEGRMRKKAMCSEFYSRLVRLYRGFDPFPGAADRGTTPDDLDRTVYLTTVVEELQTI